MFFELHDEHKIGYKVLSDADLGIAESSNQTHIGLSESVLNFLPNRGEINEDSIFIYEDSFDYIDAYFDRIETPEGTFRSPKIRTGGRDCISVVSTIRGIVKDYRDNKWFLLWFGLKNEKIVFFLFNNSSNDYKYISELGLDLESKRMGVLDGGNLFNNLVQYLEVKINKNGEPIIKELEVVSQVESIPNKRYRQYDIDRANDNFKKVGIQGEQLINNFLNIKLENREISNYTWYNEESESGLPYDFHIENIDVM